MMKRISLGFLLSFAVLAGMLAGDVQRNVVGEPVTPEAEALYISVSPTEATCRGGAKARCRRCAGGKCVVACEGDYVCRTTTGKDGRISTCTNYYICNSDTTGPSFYGTFSYAQ